MYPPIRLRQLSALAVAAAVLMQGCGSSDDTTTTTGSITLSLSPTSATVQVGGSTQVSGTIVRTDFAGDVTISVSNPPAGVTGVANTQPINGGNSASVTLNVASTATPGVYTLSVVASGSGITSQTANFTLTIAAATTSSYTASVTAPGSIAQGANGTATVTFVRKQLSPADITPSVDNLPTGVTASFSPTSVTGTTTTLTLTVASSAVPGTYSNLDVRGSATGLTDVTTGAFSLTVTAAAGGSFTMTLSSSTQSIAQGANANNTLTFVRTNFTGNITPSVVNLPTGVTAAFVPNPATGTTSVLTLTVGSTVTPGVYSLVVHGSATGLADVTAPLSLTVTSSGGGSAVRLDYSACTGANLPIWVAFEDGSGAWTHVTGTGNVYTFNVSSGKGGIAVVTQSGATFTTTVSFFSQAELTAMGASCTTPSGKTVLGTVAGLSTGDAVTIGLGSASTTANFGGSSSFTLSNVANGAQTFVAYRRNSVTPGTTDKVIVRANQNIASGGSLALADFGSAEAVSPLSAPFTFSGGTTGDTFITTMSYLTTAACVSNGLYSVFGNYATSATEYGIPAAQQAATDFYHITIQDGATTSSRLASLTFHSFAAQSITLPAMLPAGTNTTLSGGIGVRRQIVITLPSDYSTLGFTYSDAAGNSTTLFASALFLGGSAVTLAMPDFTAAGGYLATYGAGAGALTTSTFALGTTGAVCTEGATTRVAILSGTN